MEMSGLQVFELTLFRGLYLGQKPNAACLAI